MPRSSCKKFGSIKGSEEVAWIERAAEILDEVVEAILAKARPGAMENDMVATIWQTIIANGGERSIYFFDPDNNRLQITAHAPNHKDELLSDEEKWRRIINNRKDQGRGLSRWESGGKKIV